MSDMNTCPSPTATDQVWVENNNLVSQQSMQLETVLRRLYQEYKAIQQTYVIWYVFPTKTHEVLQKYQALFDSDKTLPIEVCLEIFKVACKDLRSFHNTYLASRYITFFDEPFVILWDELGELISYDFSLLIMKNENAAYITQELHKLILNPLLLNNEENYQIVRQSLHLITRDVLSIKQNSSPSDSENAAKGEEFLLYERLSNLKLINNASGFSQQDLHNLKIYNNLNYIKHILKKCKLFNGENLIHVFKLLPFSSLDSLVQDMESKSELTQATLTELFNKHTVIAQPKPRLVLQYSPTDDRDRILAEYESLASEEKSKIFYTSSSAPSFGAK